MPVPEIQSNNNDADDDNGGDKLDEEDVSDDDASEDNLQPVHLYSQVYMKQNDAIEKAMR